LRHVGRVLAGKTLLAGNGKDQTFVTPDEFFPGTLVTATASAE